MAGAVIHSSAIVDPGAVIGDDTKVWHFCHIAAGARIGRGCVLGQNVYVAPTVTIGDGVRIQNNVSIYDGVLLEDLVFVGPSAVFTNVERPRAEVPARGIYVTTLVRRGATIGANATIICGTKMGAYSFLGAGAVLTRDLPDHALAVGNPARQLGWACRCGERLSLGDAPWCAACGRGYRIGPTGLTEA